MTCHDMRCVRKSIIAGWKLFGFLDLGVCMAVFQAFGHRNGSTEVYLVCRRKIY
jgi:hypothetical protein